MPGRLHLAIALDYEHGSILAGDVGAALEEALADRSIRNVAVVVVSEQTHERLLTVAREQNPQPAGTNDT